MSKSLLQQHIFNFCSEYLIEDLHRIIEDYVGRCPFRLKPIHLIKDLNCDEKFAKCYDLPSNKAENIHLEYELDEFSIDKNNKQIANTRLFQCKGSEKIYLAYGYHNKDICYIGEYKNIKQYMYREEILLRQHPAVIQTNRESIEQIQVKILQWINQLHEYLSYKEIFALSGGRYIISRILKDYYLGNMSTVSRINDVFHSIQRFSSDTQCKTIEFLYPVSKFIKNFLLSCIRSRDKKDIPDELIELDQTIKNNKYTCLLYLYNNSSPQSRLNEKIAKSQLPKRLRMWYEAL